MQALIDFLIAFLPGSIISFIIGFFSVWVGLAAYLKSKHFKRWISEEMKSIIAIETKALRESNQRHSKALRELRIRVEKLETQNETLIPTVNDMSKDIKEIYKLMVQKGGEK